ncbi:MAG: acyl-CoA dehydratase activase-related protein [Thermoanaerobacteraceae bacterium]|nr:acyl-CoA dehydratase activase-related protein [Thermoanaerobacteraceae bacterium]
MDIKVGIPRALLYYNFYPAWKVFFNELGAKVILSQKTNKKIVDDGVLNTVDEACLPVKVFFGHVINLKDRGVDYIFVPRIVSVEKRRYLCAKFLGLPDLIRASIRDIPPIIDMEIDLYRGYNRNVDREIDRVGMIFTKDMRKIRKAKEAAIIAQNNYEKHLKSGLIPREAIRIMEGAKVVKAPDSGLLKIGLLGHNYNIMDEYINMDIIKKINDFGGTVITADMLKESDIEYGASCYPKDMFWTYGREMLGAGRYMLDSGIVDGVVIVTAFGCGPDSLIKEMVEKEYKRRNTIPILSLTIDEHTGEAGIITRLEAFMDLLRWKEVV